jgi:methyl-accepting chemotaxis protein
MIGGTAMNRVLQPGIMIMNRFKFPAKFVLISFFIILPLAVTLYLFFSTNGHQIRFNQEESYGLAYNLPLKNLIIHIQEKRDQNSAWLTQGETAMMDRQIAADLTALRQVNRKYQTTLAVGDKLSTMIKKWKRLQGQLPPESYPVYTNFIQKDLLPFHTYISDHSNLTLDPDLDSYYTMDITMFKQMPLAEQLSRLRNLGTQLAARASLTAAEKRELLVALTQAQNLAAEVNSDIIIASSNNPSGSLQSIRPLARRTMAAFDAFLAIVQTKLIVPDRPQISPSEYYKQAGTAMKLNSELYDAISWKLDGLIKVRVAHYTRNNWIVVIIILIGLPLIAYFYMAFSLSTMNSLNALKKATFRLAGGDLSVRIELDTADEIHEVADSFNAMMESFGNIIRINKQMVTEVASSSKELTQNVAQSSAASQEITAIIEDMAEGAKEQVGSAEKSKTTVDEIVSNLDRAAERTMLVQKVSVNAAQYSMSGNELIVKTIGRMNTIHQAVDNLSSIIEHLEQQSDSIEKSFEVVSSIADQINLLSLNASIEAARAGEFGRGFSVVAQEVGKLSELSNASVQEISAINQQIKGNIADAARAMTVGIQEVQLGLSAVDETGKMFKNILESVTAVEHELQDVSKVYEQISSDTDHVTQLFSNMASIARLSMDNSQNISTASQDQMATVENVLALSEVLNKMADDLKQKTNAFIV